MRVGAYNPYLWTRGGGERYFLEAAALLARRHEVDVLVPAGPRPPLALAHDLAAMFGLDVGALRFIDAKSTRLRRGARHILGNYDASFTVTNSYPPPGVPRPHISVLQFPWGVADWSSLRQFRAARAFAHCDRVLTYSKFVSGWVDRLPSGHSMCVPPGVRSISPGPENREKLILAVGRFAAGGHNKKHVAMIEAFRDLKRRGPNWRLVLAGATSEQDGDYLANLERLSVGLDVEIRVNIGRAELESLYRRAFCLWHATGYGEDSDRHPELMEHFGIVVVEAMSAGCVPLVFAIGGPSETVSDGVDGLTWTELEQLVSATVSLADNPLLRARLVENAKARAADFDETTFAARLFDALPDGF